MRKPITSDDIISVKGRHLFVGNEQEKRFFIRGIAFPTPPSSQTGNYFQNSTYKYFSEELDLSGWVRVLEQLANETDINTVRMYEMDCRFNYSAFINRAAELGIYVIVPLTALAGPGDLKRERIAPQCYTRDLYEYGQTCLQNYWMYPNVIAGVVGNEVMNSLSAWGSAPCVKAYLNDLASYAVTTLKHHNHYTSRTSFPLIYATQHDSPSAGQSPDEAIKLTLEYLSCTTTTNNNSTNSNFLHDTFIFGINIESWCSSYESFDLEEDGVSESSYHTLWRLFSRGTELKTTMDAVAGTTVIEEVPSSVSPFPVTIPVTFTEMGCSKDDYNGGNNVTLKYVRDWKQIPLVSSRNGQMSDVMSGFVAYGYDGGGNPAFHMMGGKTMWDGNHTLPSSADYDNFRNQLSKVVDNEEEVLDISFNDDDVVDDTSSSLVCQDVEETLHRIWGIDLTPVASMPSYFTNKNQSLLHEHSPSSSMMFIVSLCVTCLVLLLIQYRRRVVGLVRHRFGEIDELSTLKLHEEAPEGYGSY